MPTQTIFILMLIGIFSGAVIGMQGPMSSMMTHKLGLLESVFIIHLGGTLIALIPLLIFQRGGKLSQWREIPWYVLLAGTLGLIVFAAVGYMIPRIGVTSSMMLIIIGQFLIGAVLDHFGLLGADVRQFSFTKLSGLGVMLLGAWIAIR